VTKHCSSGGEALHLRRQSLAPLVAKPYVVRTHLPTKMSLNTANNCVQCFTSYLSACQVLHRTMVNITKAAMSLTRNVI